MFGQKIGQTSTTITSDSVTGGNISYHYACLFAYTNAYEYWCVSASACACVRCNVCLCKKSSCKPEG